MKGTVVYFLLSSLSLLGDTVFLYYVSLSLLQFENGGLLSSIILGMDAFFEILLGPYLSRFVDAIDGLKNRLRRSLWIQALLISLSFLPALFASPATGLTIALIFTFALIRFLILVDLQLKASLPLTLSHEHTIPLMQTLSLSVLSQRCIFLAGSSMAPFIIGTSWFFACGIHSFSYLFSIAAVLVILTVVKKGPKKEKTVEQEEEPLVEKQRWVRWNCLFQFLTHLALSSIVFILTRSMLLAEGQSHFLQALKGPAPLYAGLLIALLMMIFLPHRGTFVAKNAQRVCGAILILSFGLILAAFVPENVQPLVFFITGIVNGFSLVGSSTFIQQKMAGKGFVKALAKGTAFAKMGVLLSLLIAGVSIDYGLTVFQLLICYGSFGILVSAAISFYAFALEKRPLMVVGK